MDLYNKVVAAEQFLQNLLPARIDYAIIAGTGLSDISEDITNPIEIPYSDIPFFPEPTVEGHIGKMIFGQIGHSCVLVLKGRFHYYEGYSMKEVTFPIRVLKTIGVEKLIITNAAGLLNPEWDAGHLVLVKDHINLHPENPLRGLNDERLGLRFPALNEVYHTELLNQAEKIALGFGFDCHQGVYVGLQGPSLETPAEYKYLRMIGGDVVGMSTVPEVIVAAQCELPVLCISVVTNNPFKDGAQTTIEEVLDVAQEAGKKIRKIILKLLQ